jgi:hypothetical protein
MEVQSSQASSRLHPFIIYFNSNTPSLAYQPLGRIISWFDLRLCRDGKIEEYFGGYSIFNYNPLLCIETCFYGVSISTRMARHWSLVSTKEQ